MVCMKSMAPIDNAEGKKQLLRLCQQGKQDEAFKILRTKEVQDHRRYSQL